MIENIQNRVRNTVGPLQTLIDIVESLKGLDADDEQSLILYNYLLNSDIEKNAKNSLNKLLILANAADIKINDNNFDIEKFIKDNNITI